MKIKIKRSILKQAVDSTLADESYKALKILMQALRGKAGVKYVGDNTLAISSGPEKPILVKVMGFQQ